ncbi:ribosomal protein S6 kinase alpha-4-like [Xenopus laevis]|uniref:Ribosomal protein S6 kinase alpha-4-like n=1 Tax=Xenopus laevis TaxID=8355 RepID=A0A8J1LCE1_XENLA|nr:ribosomal protein S6 kinase alpha-4-like [Xenopus laevis]
MGNTRILLEVEILTAKPKFPPGMNWNVQCAIIKLLKKDIKYRLGAEQDAEEIMKSSLFWGVDWDALLRQEIQPPFTPQIRTADVQEESSLCLSGVSTSVALLNDFPKALNQLNCPALLSGKL